MLVRYGVIGCGAIGQRRHIPEIMARKDAQLVALCDINPVRLAEVAGRFGNPQTFADHRQMLKLAELDAVVVGTPNYLHAPQAIDALKAGKHVLVEKPMATTRAEARAMVQAAKKAGKYLMVGQQQRLAPVHVKARELLASGAIGKVLSFRTAFKHSGPEHWCIEGSRNNWFFRKNEAVLGATGDLGIHKADLMRYLLREEFTEVGGILATLDKRDHTGKLIGTDDNAYLTLKTCSGIIGSMIVSWTNYGEPEANYTYIYGTAGVMMVATDPTWPLIIRSAAGEQRHKIGALGTNEKQVRSGVVDTFTTCILKHKPPEIDGVEGYRSLEVILTAIDAAKQGRVLRIRNTL